MIQAINGENTKWEVIRDLNLEIRPPQIYDNMNQGFYKGPPSQSAWLSVIEAINRENMKRRDQMRKWPLRRHRRLWIFS